MSVLAKTVATLLLKGFSAEILCHVEKKFGHECHDNKVTMGKMTTEGFGFSFGRKGRILWLRKFSFK